MEPGEDEQLGETRLDRPARRSTPPADQAETTARSSAPSLARASLAGASATTVRSPLEVLARDEILRTRMFCYMGFVIAVGGLAAMTQLPGGYYETRVFVVGIVCGVAGLSYLLHRTRTPATFNNSLGVLLGWY